MFIHFELRRTESHVRSFAFKCLADVVSHGRVVTFLMPCSLKSNEAPRSVKERRRTAFLSLGGEGDLTILNPLFYREWRRLPMWTLSADAKEVRPA